MPRFHLEKLALHETFGILRFNKSMDHLLGVPVRLRLESLTPPFLEHQCFSDSVNQCPHPHAIPDPSIFLNISASATQ